MLGNQVIEVRTEPNTSKCVVRAPRIPRVNNVAFLRLVLNGADGDVLSRNVYWLLKSLDVLEWGHSSWYHTPVKPYADTTALQSLEATKVITIVAKVVAQSMPVTLENQSNFPTLFIRLSLVDGQANI